jgi:hypothetical protein
MNILEKIETKNYEMQLEFWAEEHRYQWGGGELSGVTGYMSQFFPFPKFVIASAIGNREGVTAEEVIGRWDEKRDYGSHVHHRIEHLVGNNWAVDESVDNWIIEHVKPLLEGMEIIGAEVLIGHPPIGLATSIDLLATKDGKIITINHKTSTLDPKEKKSGALGEFKHVPNTAYGKLCVQSELEAMILLSQYGIVVDEMYGLAIPTFKAIDGWVCLGSPELVRVKEVLTNAI